MANIIALTGMMGSGKSSVAAELVKFFPNWKLVELDFEIEKNQQLTINEIFAQKGEAYFRNVESALLADFLTVENTIISLGGGAFLSENNRKVLEKEAFTVYLSANAETIYNRIKNDSSRPLLKADDVLNRIAEILDIRKPVYELADSTVITDDKNINEIVQEVLEKYQQWKLNCRM